MSRSLIFIMINLNLNYKRMIFRSLTKIKYLGLQFVHFYEKGFQNEGVTLLSVLLISSLKAMGQHLVKSAD